MRKTSKPEEIPPEKKEWVTDGRPYSLPLIREYVKSESWVRQERSTLILVSETTLRKDHRKFGLGGRDKGYRGRFHPGLERPG